MSITQGEFLISYRKQTHFLLNRGFDVSSDHIERAADFTNNILSDLPSTLYKTLDYKTTSAAVGAIFCDALAAFTGGIVNPIEKGHPDIVPAAAAGASEEALRNYPQGLEIKCTVGNIQTGANLRAGEKRISKMTGITWQAHHAEVSHLVGLVWDFIQTKNDFQFPGITGVFSAEHLTPQDWGAISGTTGRNTKVTGMKASGKLKMGQGWAIIANDPEYNQRYSELLGCSTFR